MDIVSVSGWVLAGVLATDRIRLTLKHKPRLNQKDLELMINNLQSVKMELRRQLEEI